MYGKALDLAFRTEQFSALDLIANDLDDNSDSRVLERCAEFFAQNQQYNRAVQLLAYAKKYTQAVEMCGRKNVHINETLTESLTPSKESMPNTAERSRLLEQIADCCVQQGSYHFAAKKYTQAGNKLQAMRALLKSGDTDKIIFFANTARSKEIFILAGNYLQTIDWKDDPAIMKQIETFYTRGAAPQSLAGFYQACAQVEIDDYRDYEKAASAFQEALRCLNRASSVSCKNVMDLTEQHDQISKSICNIRRFLDIRAIYQENPNEAVKQLQELADDETDVNKTVRLGDIYSVLIIHNARKGNFKKAYNCIEQLRQKMPRLDISRYVKPTILDSIYEEMGLPKKQQLQIEVNEEEVDESHALQRRENDKNEDETSFEDTHLAAVLRS